MRIAALCCAALFACSSYDETPTEIVEPDPTTTPAATTETAPPPPVAAAPSSSAGNDPNKGPPAGKVAAFIAQGQLGRTLLSCDDGNTWGGNHSWDIDGDAFVCGMKQDVTCGAGSTCSYVIGNQCITNTCCTVGPDAPAAIAIGNLAVVTAWGHGTAGPLRSSTDGIDWMTRATTAPSHVAFGNGRFVSIANSSASWSTDGATWNKGGDTTTKKSLRSLDYADVAGGRFIGIASNGGVGEVMNIYRDIVISADGGLTWSIASGLPSNCAIGVGGGLVSGNGIVLVGDQNGTVCKSVDGGQTWTVTAIDQTVIAAAIMNGSRGLWTGTEFAFWAAKSRVTSADGVTWTTTALAGETAVGTVARGDSGTYVGIVGSYSGQKFLRSTDGVTWQAAASPPGVTAAHTVRHIAFGYIDPSVSCPKK